MIVELLLCTLLISSIITLSFLCLGRFGPLYIFLLYGLMVVLWGWFGPEIILLPQIFIALTTLITIFLIVKNPSVVTNFKTRFQRNLLQLLHMNVMLIIPFVLMNIASTNLLVRFASLGYDNYGHLGLFYRTFFINGFEYSPFANQTIINSLSMHGYPLLQTSTWTFLLKLTGNNLANTDQLLRFFYFFEIYTFMFLIYLFLLTIFRKESSDSRFSSKKTWSIALVGIVSVVFSPVMTLIWQGFPPTFFGLLTVYGTFLIFTTKLKMPHKIFYMSVGIIVTGYSYQLFVPIALIPLVSLLFQSFKSEKRNLWITRVVVTFLSLGAFAAPLVLASQSIPSYLFSFGGIEPPKIYLLVALPLLTLITFPRNKSTLIFHIGFLISLFLGGALTIYAYLTETGMYYPIKLVYLAITLGVGALLQTASRRTNTNPLFKLKLPFFFHPLFIFVCLAITSAFMPKYFSNSTTSDILRNHNFGSKCVVAQLEKIKAAETFGSENIFFLIKDQGSDSDLLTRWFNSLNGKNDDDVFNFSIPYGMAENQDLFLKEYMQKNPNYRYLIYEVANQDTCELKMFYPS